MRPDIVGVRHGSQHALVRSPALCLLLAPNHTKHVVAVVHTTISLIQRQRVCFRVPQAVVQQYRLDFAKLAAIAFDYRMETEVIMAVLHSGAVGNGDVIMRKLQITAFAQPVAYRGWVLCSILVKCALQLVAVHLVKFAILQRKIHVKIQLYEALRIVERFLPVCRPCFRRLNALCDTLLLVAFRRVHFAGRHCDHRSFRP